ncbi:MAG TPA: hypothetical protein VLI39_13700 [Sedimentisphaerales bacterium]|nr:hypothetical protein [Sedimentisphaerales bacterium]
MMFDAVAASSMKEHDKAEADFALISLLDGAFPTPDRICLLRGVWPEELVQKYLNARERNLAAKAAHERLQQSGENSETNVDSRNPIASP